jgi:transcriptional regulator with XRE-family HTH domain
MTTFGEQLRLLRQRRGLRQTDVVTRLGDVFARSTIANVECGREAPSERLWEALSQAFPDEVPQMEDAYLAARRRVASGRGSATRSGARAEGWDGEFPLGGPLVIERRDFAVVFRESRNPEEILDIIDVRARQDGVSTFVTKMWATQQEGFRASAEVVWGGEIVEAEHVDRDGRTFVMSEVQFGRPLRRGERHSFAVRSWVERATVPDTGIDVAPALPTAIIAVHVAFIGPQPASVWAYGPVADDSLSPKSADEPGACPTLRHGGGRHSAVFERPEPGDSYGIDWSWD